MDKPNARMFLTLAGGNCDQCDTRIMTPIAIWSLFPSDAGDCARSPSSMDKASSRENSPNWKMNNLSWTQGSTVELLVGASLVKDSALSVKETIDHSMPSIHSSR